MLTTVRPLLVTGLLLCTGPIAAAQSPTRAPEPRQGAVPAELVRLLVGGYTVFEEAEPEILVHRLPERVSRAVTLPREACPLVSAVYPAHSLSVVALPQAPKAALKQFGRMLEQGGWKPVPALEEGGFVFGSMGEAVRLCRGEHEAVSLSATEAPGRGSHVRIFHSTDERLSGCRPDSRPRSPLEETPIPALVRPEGARMVDGGTSSSEGRAYASVRLATDMTPQALVAHYGAQLRERGWMPGAQNSVDGSAMQAWSATDARGRPWQVLLIATAPEGGERELLLHASRVSVRR